MENQKVAAAFVAAQKAFAPVIKNKKGGRGDAKYAELAVCIDAVMDALNANDIALMQICHESENGVLVETLFLHSSGESLSGGKLYMPAPKNDPQGYGSALTYARRYALMPACGIAPEDDDAEAAKGAGEKPTSKLKPYPQKDFDENLAKWVALVNSGKTDLKGLMATLKTKADFNEAQIAEITKACEVPA